MAFDKLKNLNQSNLDKEAFSVDKAKSDLSTLRTQEVFVKSIQSLAEVIQGHTTKTVLVNQLKDYVKTDDITKLDNSLGELLDELKTHKNTDLSPVVSVLNDAVNELKAIPKESEQIVFPESKDYSESFSKLLKATNDVMGAIKAQKLNVEAPIVNVDAPIVNVDAPDLKPLGKDLEKSFKEAVKLIVIPQPKDYTRVLSDQLNEQKKTNRILEELPTGGGSGSSSIAPFLQNGALPVISSGSTSYQSRNDTTTDTNLVYLGKALPGSATTDAAWQIKRYDKSAGYMSFADDETTFTKQWSERTTYGY